MSGNTRTSTEAGQYKNASAAGLLVSGPGKLLGVFVNSTSSGTLKLWDNTAGSGNVIINTALLPVGFHRIPARFNVGVFGTVGGTLDFTVIYER